MASRTRQIFLRHLHPPDPAATGYEYKWRIGYMQYPSESDADALVPPALPVPNCRCGVPAEVTPPPNLPPMTEEEKQEVVCRHVRGRPLCKCGVATKLMRLNIGVAPKFTPFFRCSLKTHDGWSLCDFNEYIHGPKLLWPTEEQVREFETIKAPWPCESFPSDRCKCGILATQGMVSSELGYGWFCGNAYVEYWVRNYSHFFVVMICVIFFVEFEDFFKEGRTYDWEGFYGRHELGSTSEPWKSRETKALRDKIRS
uniref:Zinc finger GRF-type domain-containing protein n=1 Tax=Setaria viridis TaxID=4556 RepID=A0A4U6UPZ7_SETVI|nr:hypothetical protein SEVIR_5G277200v2 [Setaria viridis]